MSVFTERANAAAYASEDRYYRNSDLNDGTYDPTSECVSCREDCLLVNEAGLCAKCAEDEAEVGL